MPFSASDSVQSRCSEHTPFPPSQTTTPPPHPPFLDPKNCDKFVDSSHQMLTLINQSAEGSVNGSNDGDQMTASSIVALWRQGKSIRQGSVTEELMLCNTERSDEIKYSRKKKCVNITQK